VGCLINQQTSLGSGTALWYPARFLNPQRLWVAKDAERQIEVLQLPTPGKRFFGSKKKNGQKSEFTTKLVTRIAQN